MLMLSGVVLAFLGEILFGSCVAAIGAYLGVQASTATERSVRLQWLGYGLLLLAAGLALASFTRLFV